MDIMLYVVGCMQGACVALFAVNHVLIRQNRKINREILKKIDQYDKKYQERRQ